MRVNFRGKRYRLQRPIVPIEASSGEVVLSLKDVKSFRPVQIPAGYEREPYRAGLFYDVLKLLNRGGFAFSEGGLRDALHLCIPGGVHILRDKTAAGGLAAMMMSRHLSSDRFEFGGRIDWLVTDPSHRGQGLGVASASLATEHLILRGYTTIWVTTQASRPSAVRIFQALGFT